MVIIYYANIKRQQLKAENFTNVNISINSYLMWVYGVNKMYVWNSNKIFFANIVGIIFPVIILYIARSRILLL